MGYVQDMRSLVGQRPLLVPGAAVLIINDQNCLLLQHRKDNQQWALIGGSMEIGESFEDTAKREAFEETGLEIEELQWLGLFSGQTLIYEYPNGDVVANVVAAYVVPLFSGQLKVDNSEAHELHFFELSELPTHLSPPDRPLIEQYLRSQTAKITIP